MDLYADIGPWLHALDVDGSLDRRLMFTHVSV